MYPPFDVSARCPKCDYDAVTATYYNYNSHYLVGFSSQDAGGPEALRRTCNRCSYSWFEACTATSPKPLQQLNEAKE